MQAVVPADVLRFHAAKPARDLSGDEVIVRAREAMDALQTGREVELVTGNREQAMRYLAIALVSFIALTGFNSFGPVKESNYQALATAQLPSDAGEVIMSGPGAWAINANGFADIRSQSTPLLGSLLLTKNGLYFQQWIEPENRYDTMLLILHRDIASLRTEEFGRSVRVVVKKKDLSVTSISYMSGSGGAIDQERTRQALELLKAQLSKRSD